MKKSSAREKFEELKKAQEELRRMQGLQNAENSVEAQNKKPDLSGKIAKLGKKAEKMKEIITKKAEKLGNAKETIAKKAEKLGKKIQNVVDGTKEKFAKSKAAVTIEDVQGMVSSDQEREDIKPKPDTEKKAEVKSGEESKAEKKAEVVPETEPKEEAGSKEETAQETKVEGIEVTGAESQGESVPGTEEKEIAESQEESVPEAEVNEKAELKAEPQEEPQPESEVKQTAAMIAMLPGSKEAVPDADEVSPETPSPDQNRWNRFFTKCKTAVFNHKKAILYSGTAILAVLICIYGYFAFYYQDKFFKGTYINQVACEGMTVDQVEEQIREEVENYKIAVVFRGDITEDITGGDIDYQYVSSGEVQKIKDQQNPLLWFSGLFKERDYTAEKTASFHEEKLREKMESMDPMKESSQIVPTDARVDYIDGEFVIIEEEQGSQLDTEAVIHVVEQAIHKSVPGVNLEEADVYAKPGVTKEDAGLQKECEQLNELARVNVTYRLPNGEKILNGEDLKTWLDVDEEGNYVKNEETFEANIKEFVAELAEEVDTRGKARPFHTTSGLDVTVKGGTYGWRIDQENEIAALTANIENHETVEREPEYNSREKYTENNGLGTTYIEVNLTEQHLYYYQNGEIVLESDFVSGMMIKSRYTPEGVYFLSWKTTDTYLTGQTNPETGKPSYRSHVNYWMPFNGGIGFHDALWRGSFGGAIYKNGGSHGCINMPLEKAKKLYAMIDKETPIVCVYTGDYELYY